MNSKIIGEQKTTAYQESHSVFMNNRKPFVNNCEITPRKKDDYLFDNHGHAFLEGYAVLPIEELNKLRDSNAKAQPVLEAAKEQMIATSQLKRAVSTSSDGRNDYERLRVAHIKTNEAIRKMGDQIWHK
jgi:hypothetical protein